ncbi:MAG: replicative DNA helicase [Bacillota bacterium]
MTVPADRLPPHNTEAEQSVLGSILLDREAVAAAIELLSPEDFYQDVHQIIYRTVVKLYDENRIVDVVTLGEALRQQGELERVGGLTYLTTLARTVPTAANVRHYAEIVEAKATLRNLISTGTKIVGKAYEASEDPKVLLDQAEQMIFDIAQRGLKRPYNILKHLLVKAYERLERIYDTGARVTGVPTGFQDLDDLTSGLQPSDLVILAGRPSQGKTTFAINIAQNVAVRHKIGVGLFSLEMSAEQLAIRFMASEGGLNSMRLRAGKLKGNDFDLLSKAMGVLAEAPIFVDDSPSLSALELRARARRMKRDHNVGLVIVDYLQLMRGNWRTENRQQEIAEISRALKALARELEVPVLALSQLSRAVETRPDRRPQLSDLRESGAIEQDADVVSFIHVPPDNSKSRDRFGREFKITREEGSDVRRLDIRRGGRSASYELTDEFNLAEIIIAKQRNGPTGSFYLFFSKDVGRFGNIEIFHEPPPARDEGQEARLAEP